MQWPLCGAKYETWARECLETRPHLDELHWDVDGKESFGDAESIGRAMGPVSGASVFFAYSGVYGRDIASISLLTITRTDASSFLALWQLPDLVLLPPCDARRQ